MNYVARKLALLLLTLLLVSLLAFVAFAVLPSDPATKLLGTQATPERVAALRAELGLDRPSGVRYWSWLTDFVRGDFGTSYNYNMPVRAMIGEKLPVTMALTVLSFLLTVLLSFPLGILMAQREGSRLDRFWMLGNQLGMSVPPFFTGILLSYVFGLGLHCFQAGELPDPQSDLGGYLLYLLFPALAVAIPKAAMTARLLRGAILQELEQDYVRTARSRGLTQRQILTRHVLKNALLPVITFLALTVADIVAGSVVVEQVFVLPGLGRLLLSSILNRDYPVAQAIVVLLALLVVLLNTLADALNRRIDPRLRLGKGGR